jgi:hypothetical protein
MSAAAGWGCGMQGDGPWAEASHEDCEGGDSAFLVVRRQRVPRAVSPIGYRDFRRDWIGGQIVNVSCNGPLLPCNGTRYVPKRPLYCLWKNIERFPITSCTRIHSLHSLSKFVECGCGCKLARSQENMFKHTRKLHPIHQGHFVTDSMQTPQFAVHHRRKYHVRHLFHHPASTDFFDFFPTRIACRAVVTR